MDQLPVCGLNIQAHVMCVHVYLLEDTTHYTPARTDTIPVSCYLHFNIIQSPFLLYYECLKFRE